TGVVWSKSVQLVIAILDYEFSSVCEKLIAFCVEAERSGILSYQKSITVLYDMFGFRRDEFDRLNNEEKYLATMNDTEESTKNSIIDFAVGNVIVDVGSGGGVLLDLLEATYPGKQIVGTDISENVISVLNDKKMKENHRWSIVRHNFVENAISSVQPDTIIFSSILHEIFSYTQTPQGRFRIESVKSALHNAYESLPAGGRIIIRDGIKSPSDAEHQELSFSFKEKSGLEFFNNYCKDFKGLPNVDRKNIHIEGLQVTGDYNFMREFLYTYTWGEESYANEVNEQFGYFTLTEFKKFFSELGATIIKAEEFVEPGYIEHLSDYIMLDSSLYPMSNCIIVVEK
ncbi:MAG: methyltransferase, partial [Eubacteriales bacterium]|nr:methyltransferase [Eubacteriales bacterium]